MNTYIITYTSGTVRNSNTEIAAEIKAVNPRRAIKKFIKENYPGKGVYSSWKFSAVHDTQETAKLENPAGYISDLINFFYAQKGSLPRNSSNELHFLIKLYSGGNVTETADIWDISAGDALDKYMKNMGISWEKTIESRFRSFAEKPVDVNNSSQSGPVEWIEAKISYDISEVFTD